MCLAMVLSDSSLYSNVHRNPFGGPGPFQAPYSRFGPRVWRWSFPIQVCLQKCTETHLAGLGPPKPHFRGLARVLGDGHFLFKLVFKSAPKPSLAALGPSRSYFRGLGSMLGDGPFLLKLVFKSAPKPIWRAWALPGTIFEVWHVSLAMVISYSSLC